MRIQMFDNMNFELDCPYCGEVSYESASGDIYLINDAMRYVATCPSCNKNVVMYVEVNYHPHCLSAEEFMKTML